MNGYRIDPDQVRLAWELFIAPGQVTELRALNAKVDGSWRTGTYTGYFNNVDALIAALAKIDYASAVYYMPNPVKPALLARCFNRACIATKDSATDDKSIVTRRWLLIDADPVRPAGISATDEEKQAALDLITACDYELWEQGFPPGIFCDSGNGEHLLIPIDRPADSKFCEHVLKWLDKRCSNALAKVDTTVHNPARIWKLPGTLVCKGDHCPEIGRVWRMAKVRQSMNGVTNHARM